MTQQREIAEIYKIAGELMREHGLIEQGWVFELSNHKMIVGRCEYTNKRILFSIHYLFKSTEDEIRNTILHEIAHALMGPGYGHGYEWRRMAIEVGARPERCASHEAQSVATPNFYIECSGCGKRWPRYRLKRSLMGRRSACCSEPLKFYRVEK